MIEGEAPEQDPGVSPVEPSAGEKRGRGRPSKGPPVPVRLSAEERAYAETLGRGVAAEGVRIALNVVSRMDLDAASVIGISKLPLTSLRLSVIVQTPTPSPDAEAPVLPLAVEPELPATGSASGQQTAV